GLIGKAIIARRRPASHDILCTNAKNQLTRDYGLPSRATGGTPALFPQCNKARLPGFSVVAWPSSGITMVFMRLGTSPTGMALMSFMAGTSITDTERCPALET